MVFIQLCWPLANEYEITVVEEKHCRSKKTSFSVPVAGTQGSETQCLWQTSVSVQNSSQIRLAVSEEMRTSQTDRQTDRQTDTANLISPITLDGWVVFGSLHRGGDWAGTQPTQSPPRWPNVTAHPSTASVPIIVLPYNGPLLCGSKG